jgi:hypothetical protein
MRPYSGPKELHLLLKILWLYIINAKFFIRESIIKLSNINRGE